MIDPKFIHLKVHTEYSMIDGLSSPLNIIKKAVSLNMPAIGITDTNNLFGAIKFYNISHSFGIKPIIGIDFNVKNSNEPQTTLYKITLLAKNYCGYKNLIILTSKAYENRRRYKNVFIKTKWLSTYNDGIIVLSGGCYGNLGKYLLANDYHSVNECLLFYKEHFPNSFYLEIMRTGRYNEEKFLQKAIRLALLEKVPIVVTNDICFLNQNDYKIHQIRVAINKGLHINDVSTVTNYSNQQFLRSEKEMCKLFKDFPQGLVNSVEIAKRCNVIFSFKKYFLPSFNTGLITTKKFLVKKAKKGLEDRLKKIFPNENYRNKFRNKYDLRLSIELNVINKMGFSGYFLIVMEFIQWAKSNNIPVGPGRGSGAGSLVAYALCITELNPIQFDLLFERFLNPERINLPDFDIDFCMEQRDQVIEHVSNLYGFDSVSQIITFGTMTAKAVIRDVGRVLGYPYGFINSISKLIPMDPGMTLKKAFSSQLELVNYYNKDEEVRLLINTSKKLEGVIRNIGKHAGGLVISSEKIIDHSPLYFDEEGKNTITQFDKSDIEKIGLVKFDFLGLRTLTIIKWTVDFINKNVLSAKNNNIDILSINLDDKKVFKTLRESNTIAIFQLESFGMKDLIRRLQPDNFEDIIALVALFRPGPLQSGMVDNFINRKHGKEKIYYPDKKWEHIALKPILKSTYGIILYQEQVMKIAQILAGYTLGKADILRRAMSKKDPIEMEKQRSIFISGTKKLNINKQLSIKIFNLLEKFAGYGFNKSHSAAYALLSYQTLWLKHYYPNIFMASVMTSEINNIDKIIILVDECYRMGIKILPPDINKSRYEFIAFGKDKILYGMGAIKGIGKSTVDLIIKIRNEGHKFINLFDLCTKINSKRLTRKIIEKLIMSGSCDCFGEKRSVLDSMIDNTIIASKQHSDFQQNKQISLFGDIIDQYNKINYKQSININEWSEENKILQERKVLGFYLTGHPINQYLQELIYYTKGLRLNDVDMIKIKSDVIVFGLILSIKFRLTKNKKTIATLILDDNSNKLEIIIFSNIITKFRKLLVEDNILIFKGRLFFDKFKTKIGMISDNVIDIETARNKTLSKVVININEQKNNKNFFSSLKNLLNKYNKGKIPIIIKYIRLNTKTALQLKYKWNIVPSNNFFCELKKIIGENKIFLKFNKLNRDYLF